MPLVHRLQRAHHDLEVRDLAGGVPGDYVHAVDQDALAGGLKFEHGGGGAVPFVDVAEAVTEQPLQGGGGLAIWRLSRRGMVFVCYFY